MDLVINTVKPDAVIVELCKGRSAVLYQEPSSRGQPPPLSMTGMLTTHKGKSCLLARLLLRSFEPVIHRVFCVFQEKTSFKHSSDR